MGVCGSDLHVFKGHYKRGLIVPGHEIVARVVELGGEVLDAAGGCSRWATACPEPQIPCWRCRFCRGIGSQPGKIVDYSACEAYFIFGLVPVGDPPCVVGGWSEYIQAPANATGSHRPGLAAGSRRAAGAALGGDQSRRQGRVRPGDTVVVQGPGPLGLLTVAAARTVVGRIILVG